MKNYYQPDCPAFLGFLTHNLETPSSVLKEAIKTMLTGDGKQEKILELRGPCGTGKQMFMNLLIALTGKNNSIRISVQDNKICKYLECKDYRLIIINESLFTLNKRELRNLESLTTSKKLKGLLVKEAEVRDSEPKPLPAELVTTVLFKQNRENDYQNALKSAIDNELEAIRRWALED